MKENITNQKGNNMNKNININETAHKTIKHRNVKPYNLDYIGKRIVLTKKFCEKAQIFGNAEFEELVNLQKVYPDYKIEMRTANHSEKREAVKGLTIPFMEKHITKLYGKDSNAYKAFESQRELAKAYKNPYSVVRNWFCENFPNWNNPDEVIGNNSLSANDRAVKISNRAEHSDNQDVA